MVECSTDLWFFVRKLFMWCVLKNKDKIDALKIPFLEHFGG